MPRPARAATALLALFAGAPACAADPAVAPPLVPPPLAQAGPDRVAPPGALRPSTRPEERERLRRLREERRAEREARLARMTPEQRAAREARRAERLAAREPAGGASLRNPPAPRPLPGAVPTLPPASGSAGFTDTSPRPPQDRAAPGPSPAGPGLTREERLALRERRMAEREARLAAMTPEQRAAWEARLAERRAVRAAPDGPTPE
ncbi:hypothetical protein ACE7GA_04945 [Roseomonas sp. CCTCC AB2023176]|uniref:hypothetical protein n=1 Tax=Roseomonas sp. CCTCC AB2023176 TaxID=3342640 RepID=UPI0035DA70B0